MPETGLENRQTKIKTRKWKMATQKFLVLFYCGNSDEKAVRVQVDSLTDIIRSVHTSIHFCSANELVNRNSITSNPRKILKEASYRRLRPFRFFICRN